MSMIAIAAADLNWGIGFGGRLLERIPEDMQFFKQTTLGKIVVMGRTTFESLPGQAPLKERLNIVLSHNPSFHNPHVRICSSLDDLFRELGQQPAEDIFVIGGATVYRQLLPYCQAALVTRIENNYSADCYFPNLDEAKNWKLASRGEMKNYNNIRFRFVKYVNEQAIKPSPCK